MFALEANVLFIAKQVCTLFLLFRSCRKTARTLVHRSIRICRIYNTLDSEYIVYFFICNVSWVLKRTVSTKRLFLCIQTHIFVRLGPSVRLEEKNNFFDSILFATNQPPFSSNYRKLAVTCLKPAHTLSSKELNI